MADSQLWPLCPLPPHQHLKKRMTWKRECTRVALPKETRHLDPQPTIRTAGDQAEDKTEGSWIERVRKELSKREVGTSSDRDRVCLSLPPACCRGLPTFAGCSSQHQLEFPKLCLGHLPECGGHSPLHIGLAAISCVSGIKQNPSVARGQAAPLLLPRSQQALMALLGLCLMCTRVLEHLLQHLALS